MTDSIFPKKTCYHSQLVGAGTIEVLITSEPTRSKFKKDQFFIAFKYQGRDQQLIIENEAIQRKLAGLNGHVVSLTASGSRDDADIEIFDAAGPASSKTHSARTERQPQQAPPTGDDPVRAAKLRLLQDVNARLLSMEAALVVKDEWDARHDDVPMTEEQYASVVNCFYVSLDRSGLIALLPYEMIPPPKKHSPPATRREPEPAPRPDDDEIPF